MRRDVGTKGWCRTTETRALSRPIQRGNGDMNDGELKQRITERARQLWEEAGRPEGRDMEYWLQAEEELAPLSVAVAEDPMEALDHSPPGVPPGKGEAS